MIAYDVQSPVRYASLLHPHPQLVAEEPAQYHCLTERHLQAIWLEQKYFRNLKTVNGEPVEVLSSGIWNAEAGPDFLKAHLRIGSREMRGDVEIHLMDESWENHSHHCDERYNDVIFHLSLWKPRNPRAVTTQNGKVISQGYLEDILTVPHARLVQLIDLDLYPYKKFIGSGKCAQTLFSTLDENSITAFFRDAADWRLSQKRGYLTTRHSGADVQLSAGIAMALGYKNNTYAFLDLFGNLNDSSIAKEEEVLAQSLKVCGFFEKTYQDRWVNSTKYSFLKDLSATLKSVPTVKLVLNNVRPLNHPIRRLVVLAKLLTDPEREIYYSRIMAHWDNSWSLPSHKHKWTRLLRQFRELLPHYYDSYWNHHYLFESEPRKEFVPLLGDDLKNEVLINTLLPLLQGYVAKKGNPMEEAAFHALYVSIPASRNSKTKYLVHRFFGDTPKGAILDHAEMEQGAFQVHRDFCIHYEASCQGCPFVDQYKAKCNKQ